MGDSRLGIWVAALLPLALLGALLALIVQSGTTERLRGSAPPVEVVTFQRVELGPAGIRATILNDGPDRVTIAQVMVDEAYWTFHQEPEGELRHLGRAVLEIPYPWVEGEAHELRLVSATGVTFDHEIAVAVETPRPSLALFGLFAVIGVYIGVLPVALGLLWFPVLRRLRRSGMEFVLALTIGLLVFLLIDTAHEGMEAAADLAHSLQGVTLFAAVGLVAFLLIEGFGRWLQARQSRLEEAWASALLIAIGIGLHNFGEGLAIGAAFALGEAALGSLLILGFTLHNTTEGLAIVAPLARSRARIGRLAVLGLIAGVPTIAGAWLGGFVYSPFWSVVFLAIGAGAIAQVVVQITRNVAGERPIGTFLASRPVVAGLVAGFAVMYLTGMLVS